MSEIATNTAWAQTFYTFVLQYIIAALLQIYIYMWCKLQNEFLWNTIRELQVVIWVHLGH